MDTLFVTFRELLMPYRYMYVPMAAVRSGHRRGTGGPKAVTEPPCSVTESIHPPVATAQAKSDGGRSNDLPIHCGALKYLGTQVSQFDIGDTRQTC